MNPIEDPLLTVAEIAEQLRIGRRTAERLIALSEIRTVLIRRRRFARQSEVDRYLRLAEKRGRVA